MRSFPLFTLALLTAMLAACANESSRPTVWSTEGSTLVRTGEVTAVHEVTVNSVQGPGVGAVVGAVLGGLIGNSVGGGDGRTLATVGGAIAGGIAGHQIEEAKSRKTVTQLTVRFQNGEVRVYHVEPGEAFRVGDQVKLVSHKGEARITH